MPVKFNTGTVCDDTFLGGSGGGNAPPPGKMFEFWVPETAMSSF